MRLRARQAAAVVTVLALGATPLAGCGKSGPKIPKSRAADLIALLQQADRQSRPLRCNDLQQQTIPDLQAKIGRLGKVDKDIRDTLSEGVDNLLNIVKAKCSNKPPKTKTTSTTSETTPPTTATTSSSTPTTTSSSTTSTTQSTRSSSTPTNTGPSGGVAPGAGKNGKGNGAKGTGK